MGKMLIRGKGLLGLAFFLFFSFLCRAQVSREDYQSLLNRAEELWLEGNYDESDKVLDDLLRSNPDKAELYWRKARNMYDRLEDIPREKKPSSKERIRIYREIETLSEKCREKAPDDGNCYLWKGIGMGRRGTTQGILNSLSEIDDLEKLWLKAESLKPSYRAKDGSANSLGDIYCALGQFYRVVPDWAIIRVLFGTRGDIKKSVEYQRKAVMREPLRIEYNKELGISLLCYGQKNNDPKAIQEGRGYLEKVLTLKESKQTDKIDKEHSKLLLEKPDLACGYSRDAQQEVSKEEFDKKQKKE